MAIKTIAQWNADSSIFYSDGDPATAANLQKPSRAAKSEIDFLNSYVEVLKGSFPTLYSATENYNINHLVSTSDGKIWKCLTDDVLGITPVEGASWTELHIGDLYATNSTPLKSTLGESSLIYMIAENTYAKYTDPTLNKCIGWYNHVDDKLTTGGIIKTGGTYTPGEIVYISNSTGLIVSDGVDSSGVACGVAVTTDSVLLNLNFNNADMIKLDSSAFSANLNGIDDLQSAMVVLDTLTPGGAEVIVENVLTSTSTTNALSANMGRTLNDTLASKLNNTGSNVITNNSPATGLIINQNDANYSAIEVSSESSSEYCSIRFSEAGSSKWAFSKFPSVDDTKFGLFGGASGTTERLIFRGTGGDAFDMGTSLNRLSTVGTYTSNGCWMNNTGTGIGLNVETNSTTTYGVNISSTAAQYSLLASGIVYAAGFLPFTGSHISFTTNQTMQIGDIVVSNGSACNLDVNETYLDVSQSSKENDKTVFGVLSTYTPNIQIALEGTKLYQTNSETQTRTIIKGNEDKVQYILDNYTAGIFTNSVGEGMINVCAAGGNIENGDYITTSSVSGKGMKQSDDLLHNYTVAKATESVDFTNAVDGENGFFLFDGVMCKMIACTYHCG